GCGADALSLVAARTRPYVSNWADGAGRGHGAGGTVSVVDVTNPTAPQEIGFAQVGHHPEAVELSADHPRLFVTNTNDDTISVLDVTSDPPALVSTEPVGVTGAPIGTHPDALALAPDAKTLF